MELESKVAIVSGGAVRIGRALSLALAGEGCHVFIHYGRSFGAAEETKAAVEALGVKARIYAADLEDPSSVRGIVPAAISHFGRVDVLINNAAIFLSGRLADTSQQIWDRQFAVNLTAPFILCQDFAAQIPAAGRGSIINLTDARIYRPAADHFAYRLTKAALLAMTETLAHDLAPRITVNALALGAILPPHDKDEEYLQDLTRKRLPLQEHGSSNHVAQNVLHLLSQDFLTGVSIRVDGGEFL